MRPRRLQSRSFSKQPERVRLRDLPPPPIESLRSKRAGVIVLADVMQEAVPKTEPKRNRTLLDMAPRFGCLLRIPGWCEGDLEGVVACHSNLLRHGKGRGRKADDQWTCAGCFMCHRWLDQGKAPADEKDRAFTQAHIEQVKAWQRVAIDPAEPKRFRNAARWALEQLNAIPTGEI